MLTTSPPPIFRNHKRSRYILIRTVCKAYSVTYSCKTFPSDLYGQNIVKWKISVTVVTGQVKWSVMRVFHSEADQRDLNVTPTYTTRARPVYILEQRRRFWILRRSDEIHFERRKCDTEKNIPRYIIRTFVRPSVRSSILRSSHVRRLIFLFFWKLFVDSHKPWKSLTTCRGRVHTT